MNVASIQQGFKVPKCLPETDLTVFQVFFQVFSLHPVRGSPCLDLFTPYKPANFAPECLTIFKF